MKTDNRPANGRSVESILLNEITGINRFDPHLELPRDQFKDIKNLDLFPGYQRTRGSIFQIGVNEIGVNARIVSKKVWRTPDGKDWVLAHVVYESTFSTYPKVLYRELTSAGEWTAINDYNSVGFAGTPDVWEPSYLYPIDFVQCEDRMVAFHRDGNSTIEYFTAGLPFRRRGLGLPKIYLSVLPLITGPSSLTGDFIYGLELVYKKDGSDFLSSGISRYKSSTIPSIFRVNLAAEQIQIYGPDTATINDNFWTHIRLWRTKRLDKASAEDNIPGNETVLYVIQEIDRASWTGSFANDVLGDDSLPNLNISGATVATVDELELEPLPNGEVGAYHNDRLWVSRSIVDDVKSDIYYSNSSATKYAEQYRPGQRVRSGRSDGQEVTKLQTFERDLIVFKQYSTGRIADGNPTYGYETLDDTIGCVEKSDVKFITKIGLIVVSADQRIRRFAYDLRYSEQLGTVNFTRHIQEGNPENDGIKVITDNNFEYWDGKLIWCHQAGLGESRETRIFVFHLDQNLGWSRYSSTHLEPQYTNMFLSSSGQLYFQVKNGGLYSINKNNQGSYDEGESTLGISWSVDTSMWQYDGGRALIEQRYFSIVAGISKRIYVSVLFSDGSTMYSDEPIELDPETLEIPNTVTDTQEYQYYAKQKYPNRTKIYGRNLYYKIEGTFETILYDMKLECFVQYGNIGPFYTKHSRSNRDDPTSDKENFAEYSRGIVHWITRSNIDQCRIHKNDKTDPIEEQVFIYFKAE